MKGIYACLFLPIFAAIAGDALAQSSITSDSPVRLLETYSAFISDNDLHNSSGVRLTKPWQIIRQDRANYHLYGIRDRGDGDDSFFANVSNRERLERMLSHGTIAPDAARMIVQGGVDIDVDIYGHGNVGEYVDVHVHD